MAWLPRSSILALAPSLALCSVVLASDDSTALKPKAATVVTPGAAVRSGPADSFYLTNTLPQDAAVEVYRQQADGWCAIRPPAESFSWVYSPHVRLKSEELAEINKDDVAARVGSQLSAQRDVVQVRLRKGEVVQIVGRDDRDGGTWYKIAPPAGEFRWVHAKDLAIDGEPPYVPANDDGVAQASHEVPAESASGGWTPIAAPPLANSTAPPPVAEMKSATISTSTTPADITPVSSSTASSPTMAKQLADLELQLSRMVAEPMASWSIEPLEQSAERLLSQADTVADREAVKAMLAKIDRFAAIRRKSGNFNVATANVAPAGVTPPGMTPVVQGQVVTPLPQTHGAMPSPYDAVGILRPVVSRRPGAPQFALVDDQGQVVTFVTPTPDMNLQPYLGRRIGIAGSRGYIPEFRRPHVTAGRITPLNETMLR